jgi:hypothetical protein
VQFPSARHTTERAQLQAFLVTPYPRDSNLLAAQLQHSLTPREHGRPATMPNTSGRRETFDAHELLAPAVYQIENMSRR